VKLKLNKPFASNSKVDEYDVRQVKCVLNRLGYYFPPKDSGITGIADRMIFVAIAQFQKERKLRSTGAIKPGDDTEQALNKSQEGQEKNGGAYIWHTMQDDKVREEHAMREGGRFTWDNPPDDGHPGEPYNCRCWAQQVSDEEIESEEVPPPKIPGTNIPDQGVPEQGDEKPPIYDKDKWRYKTDPYIIKEPPAMDPYIERPNNPVYPDYFGKRM
jgi:hypothetical protein